MEEFRPVSSEGENNNSSKIEKFKEVRSIEIVTNSNNKKLTNLKLN